MEIIGKLLGFTILFSCFCSLYNKIQAFIKKQKKKKLLLNAQIKRQKEYLERIKKYADAIKNYSICLTIDYRTKGDFNSEDKIKVNQEVFLKMAKILKEEFLELDIINMNDALIIVSNNFDIYDSIYDDILKLLSKIKSEIDKKHNVSMLPSITTDAYKINPNVSDIKKDHIYIKKCNLINKACITTTFSKKYKYINKSKYIGVPIGEYGVVDKEKTNDYELNMVCNDLSSKLERMGS